MEPIQLAEVKKDKSYVKLEKRLAKEREELQKKHQKQRELIQKQQVSSQCIATALDTLLTPLTHSAMHRGQAGEQQQQTAQLLGQWEANEEEPALRWACVGGDRRGRRESGTAGWYGLWAAQLSLLHAFRPCRFAPSGW